MYFKSMPESDNSPPLSLTAQATKSSACMFAAKAIRHSFTFIVHFILLSLLDPSDFGLMRYVTIVLAIVNMLNELGFSVSIVQKQQFDEDEAASSFTVMLFSGVMLYGGIFAGAPLIASLFHAPPLTSLIRMGGLAIPLGSISVVQRALLQRQMRFRTIAQIEVVSALISAVVAITMALRGFGVWALVFSMLFFTASSSVAFILYSSFPRGKYFNFTRVKPLWFFGVSIIFQRVFDYLTTTLDAVIIGRFFGTFELGLYSMAFDIAVIPRVAIGVILSQVLVSTFSRVQNNPVQVRSGFLHLTSLISTVSVPLFVIIYTLPHEFLSILTIFRKDAVWLQAAEPLKILVFVGFLYTLTSYAGIIWVSLGTVRLRMFWTLSMLVSMVVAVSAGIPFGIKGICWALLIRAVACMPALMFINYKLFSVTPVQYFRQLMPSLVSGVLMCGYLLLLTRVFPGSSVERHTAILSGGILSGLVLYITIFALIWRERFSVLLRLAGEVFRKVPGQHMAGS